MGKKKSGSKKLRNKKGVWEESPCEIVFNVGPAVGTEITEPAVAEVAEVKDKEGTEECCCGGGGGDSGKGEGAVGAAGPVGEPGPADNLTSDDRVEIQTGEGSEVTASVVPAACADNNEEVIGSEMKSGGGVGGDSGTVRVVASRRELKAIQKKWKSSSKSVERGKAFSPLAKNCPSVRMLEEGFDLNDIPERYGRYSKPCPWDAREFANKVSSGVSSFRVADSVIASCVANANFVSDWENIKDLITSPFTDDSRSFLLHKVGKTIYVDRFDLKNVLGLYPVYSEWPWLRQFVLDICGEKKKAEVIREGKSEKEIMSKAYFLKLLYFGLSEMLEFEVPEKEFNDDFLCELANLLPDPKLRGSKKNFMNKSHIKLAGFSILAGSDVPILKEPSKNKDASKTSLRLIHRDQELQLDEFEVDPLTSSTAMDAWLDNVLLGIPKVCIVEECDGQVTSSSIVDTDDLPALGAFDPEPMMQEAEIILKHVMNGVSESGHTYWLFKPHGGTEFKFFDLTAISKTQSNEAKKNEATSECERQNPYQVAVGNHLCTIAVDEMNLWKIATFESMIRHGSYLLQQIEPLVRVASKVLMSFRRSSYKYPGFQPDLYYDWPEEIEYLSSDDALPDDLRTLYVIISSYEKLDMGDGKLYDDLAKPVGGLIILSSYSKTSTLIDKHCRQIAHCVWAKRHLFLSKSSSGSSSFKVARMATHEPFEAAIVSYKSTDAKRLKKLESQMRRERTKNLNQRCTKSSHPSLSEKQLDLIEKTVHTRSVDHSSDLKIPVRLWMEIVNLARMALELVSALKELLTIHDNYKESLVTQFEVQIVNALAEICVRLAEANTEINLPAITTFVYDIVYGVPLMSEFGTGVSNFVADTLILNAKEVVFDAIRCWEMGRQKSDALSLAFAKELKSVQNSRIALNLTSIIESCTRKLNEHTDKFPEKDYDRTSYPPVPKYSGDLTAFYKEMMKHLDALVDYMPLIKIPLIDETKEEIAKDCKTAGIQLQFDRLFNRITKTDII